MHSRIYPSLAIIILLELLSAVILQGSLYHLMLFTLGIAYVLFPFFIVLTVLITIALLKKKGVSKKLKTAVAIWCVCLGALGLSYGLGLGLQSLRDSATRDYVTEMMSALDQIKTKEGSYPTALPSSLSIQGSFLRYPVFYSSDGKTFRFAYDDPTELMFAFEINSSDRVWHRYG